MKYVENKNYMLINDKMQNMFDYIEKGSLDSIVCDPPYEIDFMGKGWDRSGVAFDADTWRKCYDALKEGGYILAFGATRTIHRIAVAIEDAGFEIRDQLMYMYGSGFPKSMNIGLAIDKKLGVQDQWAGWGTALKPAFEPVIMARKPFKGTCVDNVIKNGTGGINIDECRIATDDFKGKKFTIPVINDKSKEKGVIFNLNAERVEYEQNDLGRYPSNVMLDADADINADWARYFYSAKASKKDRDEGLDMFNEQVAGSYKFREDGSLDGAVTTRKNIHPTVKPVELMQYLVRMVTPKGGKIMDCFMGSGSTGKATMFENRERDAGYYFIGIEMTPEYLPICASRIDYALNKYEYDAKKEKEERQAKGVYSLFDDEDN